MENSVNEVKRDHPDEIIFFHRGKNKFQKEKVYGGAFLKWLYTSGPGRSMSNILTKSLFSRIYGEFQNWENSKRKIQNFIRDFDINMDEYLPAEGRNEADPYASFNEFFIRRFKEGRRTFVSQSGHMPAFAEGRYLAFDRTSAEQTFPVKGMHLSASAILRKEKWIDVFEGGPLIIARLCPVDYHRFHFPDDGQVLDYYAIKGPLHSVNPLALKFKSDIFCTNERQVTIIESKNFGKLAYVEVGAICVGKIVQTHSLQGHVRRGEEKGYFLFGGSTVVLLGEKGKWVPAEDIGKNTMKQIETFVTLGDTVALGK